MTGLQYLRARYYGPGTGRFLSRDPFAGHLDLPQSQNPYAYGLNNPVLYTDPSGHDIGPGDAGQVIVECFGVAFLVPDIGPTELLCALIAAGLIVAVILPAANNPQQAVKQLKAILESASKTCEDAMTWEKIKNLPEAKPTIVIPPPAPLPQPQPSPTPARFPVRVQLQSTHTNHSIALQDYGNGVTTQQVVGALTTLYGLVPRSLQHNAKPAYEDAVKWTLARPPYGVPEASKHFYFKPYINDWRFDIEVIFGSGIQLKQ